jgi:chromosome segregation ATPase
MSDAKKEKIADLKQKLAAVESRLQETETELTREREDKQRLEKRAKDLTLSEQQARTSSIRAANEVEEVKKRHEQDRVAARELKEQVQSLKNELHDQREENSAQKKKLSEMYEHTKHVRDLTAQHERAKKRDADELESRVEQRVRAVSTTRP